MAVTRKMTFVYDGDDDHAHDWHDRKCECGAEGRVYEVSDLTLNIIQRMMEDNLAESLQTPVIEEDVRGSVGSDLKRCAIAKSIIRQKWGVVDVRVGNGIVVLLKADGTGLRGQLSHRDNQRLDVFDAASRDGIRIWPDAGIDVKILVPTGDKKLGARSGGDQGTSTRGTGKQKKDYRKRSAPTRPILKEDQVPDTPAA